MRLVFVNHLHPSTGLVGAVRLWRFAEELARQGHRVLFLCTPADDGQADTAADIRARLPVHDWSTPLILSCGPAATAQARAGHSGARSLRPGRLGARFQTIVDLIARGGPFYRWRIAAEAFYADIRAGFQPDLCFATFGNLDALNIARDLARTCGAPWVMDIKDPSDGFLRAPLRRLLTSRYRSVAAITLNSEFQRGHNRGWPVGGATVVYSGAEFDGPQTGAGCDPHAFVLVGAIYSDAATATFLGAFKAWAESRPVGEPAPVLDYYGADGDRVRALAAQTGASERLRHAGRVPRGALLEHCRRAAGVGYIASTGTFHHKLLELGALGRPLVVFPSESEESVRLAKDLGLRLFDCAHETALIAAFSAAASAPTADLDALEDRIGWPAVARQLAGVFETALAGRHIGPS